MSAARGCVVVFIIEGTAQGVSIIEELLVSALLVAGNLGNSGLLSDASGELLNLSLESLFRSLKSSDVTVEEFLLVVVELDAGVVVVNPLGIEVLELILEVVEE